MKAAVNVALVDAEFLATACDCDDPVKAADIERASPGRAGDDAPGQGAPDCNAAGTADRCAHG